MSEKTKALSVAVRAIYFADSSDYLSALWDIVKALGGAEAADLLEKDENAAYEKYVDFREPDVDRRFEYSEPDPEVTVTFSDGYRVRFWAQGLKDEEYILRATKIREQETA